MIPPIHIVTAMIIRDGRMLLTQRGSKAEWPFVWECPGGKPRLGEGDLAALRRELSEEIGWTAPLDPDTPPFLIEGCMISHRDVRFSFYEVPAPADFVPRIVAAENIAGAGWFTPHEARAMPSTPGNRLLYEYLMQYGRTLR